MFYEMLAQRRPFRGETREELFDVILHREPKPPRQLDPEIPPELEQICLKCLAKSVTQRYLTAADLAKDLREARQARDAPPPRRKTYVTVAVVGALLVVLGAAWAYFATGDKPPQISINPASGLQIRHRSTLRGHTGEVWSVAFAPGDQTLASAGVDKAVKLWDVPGSFERQQLTGDRGEIRCVTFAPDGQTLASAASDHTITLWDLKTSQPRQELTGHVGDVRSVVFLPDGTRLISGSVDKTIRFWDPQSGQQQLVVEAHQAAIYSVACSRSGEALASCGDDRAITLRNPKTGEPQRTLVGHTDGVSQVTFSPDGRRLASAGWDKTIRIWEVATGALLRTIPAHDDAVRSVAFSPDGQRLASGSNDHTIRLWDAKTGEELATLRGHTGPVTSVTFSSDGRILASASADKTVMMWELEEASQSKPDDRPLAKQPSPKPTKPTGTQANDSASKTGSQPALPPETKEQVAASKKLGKPPQTAAGMPGTRPQAELDGATVRPAAEPKWVELAIERELSGWKAAGAGKWTVEGGVLKGEGQTGWLATEQDYDDFELLLQYKISRDGSAGVFLRASPDGPPDGGEFVEIRIVDDTSPEFANLDPKQRTAALFKVAAPSPPVQGTPDVWHAMTIRAQGPNIRVQYEGQTVVDVNLEKANAQIPGHRHTSGRIGLQLYGNTVEFRKLLVRRLPKPVTAATLPPPPPAVAPFDAAQARKHQEVWAKYLGVPVEFTNSIGMQFILIPPGEFTMGSTPAEIEEALKVAGDDKYWQECIKSEAPQHKVILTQPIYLGVQEVTQTLRRTPLSRPKNAFYLRDLR
jgi:WD40 repeat protein